MQFRLALALFISVLLVGTSSWYRLTTTEHVPSEVVAIEQYNSYNNDYENLLRDFTTTNPETASTTFSNPPSSAGFLGRGLILDYVDLASSGQVTDNDISNLAEKYLEGVPSLNQAPAISYADIQVVSSNKNNFQSYANQFIKIHEEYRDRILKTYKGGQSLTNSNQNLHLLASSFNIAYTEASSKLQGVPVPAPLATPHLELINSYLSSATAMKAVSEAESDSGVAFAGLIALNENLDKEDVLYGEITKILTANGI